MDLVGLLIFIAVGIVAGWLAGVILKGQGFGLLWNMIIGVAGSFIGGFLFRLLKISIGGGIISAIVAALVGAIILLLVINFVKKKM